LEKNHERRPPDDLAQKLLDASEHFSGTGLDVSIDDAATMTNVPRATLDYDFSGKDDLVAFFLNDTFTLVGDAVVRAARREGSEADRLDAALHAVLGTLAAHP
jgi:AcrR family transcriptional regulator